MTLLRAGLRMFRRSHSTLHDGSDDGITLTDIVLTELLPITSSDRSETCRNPHPRARMPRYFFNTRIGDDTIPDVEGEELRDADHAWQVAKAMIVDILQDQGDHPNLLIAALVVTDQKGDIVLEFPFSEALIAEPETPSTRH
jgi:hypothetical protein